MSEQDSLQMAREELDVAIEALEREVDAPILPGELVSWCADVEPPLATVGEAFQAVLQNQKALITEILEEDPGLAARAEALDEERKEIAARLRELQSRVTGLQVDSEAGEETSEEPVHEGEDLRRDIMEWIVDARASDREIEGWFQEAIYRDRGVVD